MGARVQILRHYCIKNAVPDALWFLGLTETPKSWALGVGERRDLWILLS